MKKIALIGLGPHAKRIYLNYIKKHKINLSLVVDLESKKEELQKYLYDNNFKNTKIFTINDKYKDNISMPRNVSKNLKEICKKLKISYILIATEPKAHNMYLEFALQNNINVLTDKPITVCKNMTRLANVKKVKKEFYNLYDLAKNSKAKCNVMCQRQYHRGYELVKDLLSEIVRKYQIPITYIDIYHADGAWELPHDMLKENHPYKYGYGKLFHSGYHFIDLLSDFIKINNTYLKDNKKIVKGEVFSNTFNPNDELAVCTFEDYKELFKGQDIPDYYNEKNNLKFNKFGEKNYYGLLKFKNSHNQTITNVNLNLLHYSFSRRGWINSKDYYKENGRIRHERINIQVGTLMNIQIHSYQSKEIKDRTNIEEEEKIGGLEHFDIDIYRNVDIIGGKPFERIKLGSLYPEKVKKDMLGYNELAREEFLNNFFRGKCKSKLIDQILATEILTSCALVNVPGYKNIPNKINVNISNIKSFNILELKKYSYGEINSSYSELRDIYSKNIDNYNIDIVRNYLVNKNTYEIYLSIEDTESNVVVSRLLYKNINNQIIQYIYFKLLKYLILRENLILIKKIVQKTYKNSTK